MVKDEKERSVVITLRPRSAMAETLAPDGEVANYKGVPFLDEMIADSAQGGASSGGSGTGGASGSGGSSGNSSSVPAYSLEAESVAIGVNLPARSRLVAIHSPASASAGEGGRPIYYIALQTNGALCSVDAAGTATHVAFWPESDLGELRRGWASADIVHILGEKGIARLLYDPAAGVYVFQRSLPAPPAVDFSMEPAHMPGYTVVAGNRPKLTLSVEMPNPDEISQASVTNWLSGISGAMPEDAAQRIYKAVGEAIAEYEAAATAAGFFLTPVKGVASFGEVLPSMPTLSAESTPGARAFIYAAAYHAGSVNLEVSLTILPLQLRAEVELSEAQRLWSRHLGALRVHIAQSRGWWAAKSDLIPSGVSSAEDVDGKRTPCFILRTRSLEDVMRELREISDFRTVHESQISGNSADVQKISALLAPAGEDSPLFEPHWEDVQTLRPAGAMLSDDGLLLRGGEGEFRDKNGDMQRMQLSNALLAPMPGNGVIYREVTRIGDTPLRAVALAGSAKTASALRHPLIAFSDDGVRLLVSATNGDTLAGAALAPGGVDAPMAEAEMAKGQYRVSRYLSPDVPADGIEGVAPGEGCVYYLTERGIRKISAGTTLADLYIWPDSMAKDDEEGEEKNGRGTREVPARIVYDPASANLLLFYQYGVEVLETSARRRHSRVEMVAGDLFPWRGHLLTSSMRGEVEMLRVVRANVADSEEGDDAESTAFKGVRPQSPPISYTSGLTTRALKLGDCFEGKSVRSVDAGIGEIYIVLEGSDTLTHWHAIARGRSPLRAIHAPVFRFHRVRISLAEEALPYLRQLKITYF